MTDDTKMATIEELLAQVRERIERMRDTRSAAELDLYKAQVAVLREQIVTYDPHLLDSVGPEFLAGALFAFSTSFVTAAMIHQMGYIDHSVMEFLQEACNSGMTSTVMMVDGTA